MEIKTILKKENKEVTIISCCKIVGGKLKNFHIPETNQYFVHEKTAIRAGNDLLLRKTLSNYQYFERTQRKKKKLGAKKIIETNNCYLDTLRYVKRWDGILYLETKKRLLSDLQEKRNALLEKHGFQNTEQALKFINFRV